MKVIVSNSVAKDFDESDKYAKLISKEKALWLMRQLLDKWYEYALSRGWTQAKTVAEYVEKDHGPIYTAAFLKTI